MDENYEVIEINSEKDEQNNEFSEESVYQGRLSDCEAYIRLHENGYMI